MLAICCAGSSLLMAAPAHAGLDAPPMGARSLAMGATYVALANTADAVFLNPGGLSQLSGIEISLFYQKPFGLEDVHFGSLAATLPVSRFRASLGILTLGNGLYTEQTFSAAWSHQIRHKLYYGVALRYQTLEINGYGSSGALGLDVGFVVPFTSRVRWGVFTRNLNRPQIGQAGEQLPQTITTGLSLVPAPELIINLELFKDVRFEEEFRFGAEYRPVENLAIRTGAADNPDRFTAGFGVRVRSFTIDYAFFSNNDLGLTHQVSLSITFGAQDQKNEPRPPSPVATEEYQKRSAQNLDAKTPGHMGKVNLNTATAEELKTLPGVGDKTAQAIIQFRHANGLFKTVNDLLKVKGIGPGKLEKLKEFVTAAPPQPSANK
ncbi:MAG: helix-hairpin-helix domain-containing protein [bacterium]